MALSSGDLEYGGGRAAFAAMQTGTKWHQKLQAGRGLCYRAEVPLHASTLYDGIVYEVEGRADGVEQIVEYDLPEDEMEAFHTCCEDVRQNMKLHPQILQ
jgi:malate/lactate dehydrogenase